MAPGTAQGHIQVFTEQRPVRQLCQWVIAGKLFEPVFRFFNIGYVGIQAYIMRYPPRRVLGGIDGCFYGEIVIVDPFMPDFSFPFA